MPWHGVALALGAYGLWGLLPVYWKALHWVGAVEVLAHRVLWTVPFALVLIFTLSRSTGLRALLREPRELVLLAASAALIAFNWGIYIWAVQSGRVVECSMGYFLMPLLNVLAGALVFAERLRPGQWLAVALAGAGVVNALLHSGVLPWVGLALALTFVGYGVLRKRSRVDAVGGLFVEGLLLAPLALSYLAWLHAHGAAAFLHGAPNVDLLLIGAGVVTAAPLALHVAATRRLALKDVGLLFYLTPSLQFALGVFVYDEPMGTAQLVTFSLVWLALGVYTVEGHRHLRRAPELA